MNFLTVVDTHALGMLPLLNSPSVLGAFSVITHLGDARAIIVVAVSMAVVLWRRGKHSYWYGLAIALIGAFASAWAAKLIVARPRPLEPLIEVAGYSLPSIHAAAAAALYGYLIYATMRLMHPPHHRSAWAAVLASVVLLVGASRIYLGVHYPTDVLLGFALGGAWVWLGIMAERRLR